MVLATLAIVAVGGGRVHATPAESDPAVRLVAALRLDRIEADGTLVRTQRVTVDVRTAAGVQQFSQVLIPFLEANQSAEITVLRLRKPDGQEVDVLASAPHDLTSGMPPGLPMVIDLKVVRYAVPSLEVGDQLTFESRVEAKPLAPRQVWTEVTFSPPSDSGRQVYELDVPEAMRLLVHVRDGLLANFEESHADGRWLRRWVVESAPQAKSETAVAEKKLVEPDVEVTSFSTWDEFGRWWAALAPPVTDSALKSKAKKLTEGLTTPRDKLRAIHRYVASEIRYLSLPLGIARFRAREPEEVMRTGLGDCKDKARLLGSLAASVGIDVDEVLIHVSGRKRSDGAPSPQSFDHVVSRARLDGEELWMDATSEMTPMGSLPESDRGKAGVAVVRNGKELELALVETPASLPFEPSVRSETVGEIGPDGVIRVRVKWTIRGDEETWRLAFKYGDEEVRRKLARALTWQWDEKGSELGDITSGPPAELDDPFWVEVGVTWEMTSSKWRTKWDFWIPVPRMELAKPPKAEAGGAAGLLDPIELGGTAHQTHVARITVPPGVVVKPPVSVDVERDFATYRSRYAVEAHTLSLDRDLEVKVRTLDRSRSNDLEAFHAILDKDRAQEFDIAAAPEIVPEGSESTSELTSRCYDEYEADEFEKALVTCRRAVELDPQNKSSWNNLGRTLFRLKRFDEAQTAYEKQIEVDPNNPHAYGNLGRLYWKRHDGKEAERLLRKQVDLSPLSAYWNDQLGQFLDRFAKKDEAESFLQRAIQLDPKADDYVEDLMTFYVARGRRSQVREMVSKHTELPRLLGDRVRLAVALFELQQGPWAPVRAWVESLLDEARKSLAAYDSKSPDAEALATVAALTIGWDLLGRCALDQGRSDEAAIYFRAAARSMLEARSAVGLAAAHRASGRIAEANEALALATVFASQDSATYSRALEAAVPAAAERAGLVSAAREESWKIRSLTRKQPSAAMSTGQLWLVFAPDGRLNRVEAFEPGTLKALIAGLRQEPPRIDLPPSNQALIPVLAQASCDAGGECTIVLLAPGEALQSLSSESLGD